MNGMMMNLVKKVLLVASMVFSISGASAADGVDETPYLLIKQVSQEVLNTAKQDGEIKNGNEQKILDLVEKKILPHVDFQRMTQMAAGPNWRKATPEQQEALVKQFRTLLIYTYSGALSQVKDQRLEYRPFRAAPGDRDVEVRTQVISSRNDPIQLNYRLLKETDGWKIYDINVLGAWLIETYKGSFRAEIDKSGIDGLIDVLTKKNTKLAATFSKKKSS
jgi:phospholipid transport system substrate-binding protein